MPRPDPETRYVFKTATYVDSGGYSNTAPRELVYFRRYWSGVNTTDYYLLKQQPFGLPMNNHSVLIHQRTENLCRRYQITSSDSGANPPVWVDWTDTYLNLVGVSHPDYSASIDHSPLALQLANEKLIKKIKNQKINLAQAVAEAQKTIDLVSDTAVRIAKAIRSVRKGNLSQAARALTGKNHSGPRGMNVAKNWLALQYGWKPLLSDIHGAVEHLAELQTPPPLRFKARATVSNPLQLYVSTTNPNGAGFVTNRETSHTSTAKVGASYSLESLPFRTASQLGVTNPLSLAWELLPWTFVVDWFLPIGDYLDSLDFDSGLTWQRGYESQISKNSWVVSMPSKFTSHVGGFFLDRTFYAADIVTSRNIKFNRTGKSGPPTLTLPSFKNPLSTDHLLNALALLRSSIR